MVLGWNYICKFVCFSQQLREIDPWKMVIIDVDV